MNSDVLGKTLLHAHKRVVLILYQVVYSWIYFIPIFDRYANKMNTLPIEKAVVILKKTIMLKRHDLTEKYLDRVPTGKMVRILFKLVKQIEQKDTQSLLDIVENINVNRGHNCNDRCETIINHIKNIING